jgi:hypothetical protein
MKALALLLCCLLVPVLGLAEPADVNTPDPKRELDKLVVEKFDVSDMPAGEAIGKLSAALTTFGGGKYKIRVVTEPEKLASFKPQILPKEDPKTLLLDRPVTLAVTDAPILTLLRYVTSDIGGEIAIRGREILVYPDRGTFEDLVTQTFTLGAAKAAGRLFDFQTELAKRNIRIYEGGYAKYSEKSGKFIVRTTQSQISLITFLVD